MVIRVDVGVLSTQKRQKYPYYRVLDWNQIPLYTIMRVVARTDIRQSNPSQHGQAGISAWPLRFSLPTGHPKCVISHFLRGYPEMGLLHTKQECFGSTLKAVRQGRA